MQQQLDFSKLYCQSHPYQLVTNFCNDEKCLVGLCATCICTHTQMHAQCGTIPHYQNIRDTFASLHEQARNQISMLEQDKNRLGALRESIQVKKITIKKTIRQLREDALSRVRQQFDTLQKKIMTDISNEQKKQGYHSNIRFQTLSKNLSRQTDTLLGYIQGLNSPSYLEWTKKLKRQSLMQSNQSRLKIEKQISDNQTYCANLKWNQDFVEEIGNTLKRMFTLEFVVPKINCEVNNCVGVLRPSTIIMNRSSSQPKLSQSWMKTNSPLNLSKFAESTSKSTFFPDQYQKNTSGLQKQSFIRKNCSMISQQSECDVLDSKQNCLSRSSYIADPIEYINRSSVINNLSSYQKSGFQNDRLSNLIDMKRSSQFDSVRTSAISNQRDSSMRMY